MATDAAFTTGVLNQSVGIQSEITLSDVADGLYYWRVRALSGATAGAWSAVQSFVVVVP